MEQLQLLVGDIVHGHLFGNFGRDYYGCSRVEAFGRDWAVIRCLDDGIACTGSGDGIIEELIRSRDSKIVECHTSGCAVESDC